MCERARAGGRGRPRGEALPSTWRRAGRVAPEPGASRCAAASPPPARPGAAMESEEEQHMTTLLCMGFSDAAAIRKALRLAKNDINEAVALLTNERPGLHYGGYEPMESGQGPPGGHGSPAGGQGPRGGDGDGGGGGFDPPPAYHEVVETEVSCGLPRDPASCQRRPRGSAPGASLLRVCRRAGGRVAQGSPGSPRGRPRHPRAGRFSSRLPRSVPFAAGLCAPWLLVAITTR